MGQYKTTLTMDETDITVSLYEEDNESVDYTCLIANVELELVDGTEYSSRNEFQTDMSGSLVQKIRNLFTSDKNEGEDLLAQTIAETFDEAESDRDETLSIHPKEVLYEFEQHTKIEFEK